MSVELLYYTQYSDSNLQYRVLPQSSPMTAPSRMGPLVQCKLIVLFTDIPTNHNWNVGNGGAYLLLFVVIDKKKAASHFCDTAVCIT